MIALKVTKYQLNSFKHSTSIFYAIFIAVFAFTAYMANNSDGNVSSSGIEFATIIFIFVTGLNIFKESFYFIKGNNVSRKDYLIGTSLSMIGFSAVLSVIDVVLNRIYNIFVECPMIYDMAFGNYNPLNDGSWVQKSDLTTLVGSFLMQWGLCLGAIALGFLINLMYYRANKLVKIIISISPAILIAIVKFISDNFPKLSIEIFKFLNEVSLIIGKNVYRLFLFFIIGFLIEIGISHLLVRRATIKE